MDMKKLVFVLLAFILLTSMVSGDRECSRCSGTGSINCTSCGGAGNQPCSQCGQTSIQYWTCPDCRGSGRVDD